MQGESFGVQTVVPVGLSVIYAIRPLMRATFSLLSPVPVFRP